MSKNIMNRRDFGKLSVAAAIAALIGFEKTKGQTASAKEMEKQYQENMAKHADLMGGEKLTISMIVYSGMFLQDLVGPLTVLTAIVTSSRKIKIQLTRAA